jgi:4'-phosphopantetheinyl transferase
MRINSSSDTPAMTDEGSGSGQRFSATNSQLFSIPPDRLSLDGDEVHVWRCDLDQPASVRQSLIRSLTEDERARAERFYFNKDRNHFIMARGALRSVLGHYLNLNPAELRFSYGEYGKPSLAEDAGARSLRFNLAHSHGLALLAVTRSREIGVDLESIRPGISDESIAEHFFSTGEVRALRQLPRHLQDEAFFNCWTRKEAYIKAKGEGLSMPLSDFEVSLVPGQAAALLCTIRDPQEAARWSMRELFPAPGFVAAIVVEGADWQLRCLQWSEHRSESD